MVVKFGSARRELWGAGRSPKLFWIGHGNAR